jgi:catechol 2,3-dioxygenase-like lactoylglutathione lyase family enzyme
MAKMADQTNTVVKSLGIHHSGIPVNDVDRATEFYTRVLGFELIGMYGSSGAEGHFIGRNTPKEVVYDTAEAEKDLREYTEAFAARYPGETPATRFARMRVGHDEVVLFQRPKPVEMDSLIENGIFHQSFHISPEDMDKLIDLKREGGSNIKFHAGPILRWPHGRALYVWDTEGNYLELESEEDLPGQYLPKQ